MTDRKTLLDRAGELGLEFPKNIASEKLAELVKAAEAEFGETTGETSASDGHSSPVEEVILTNPPIPVAKDDPKPTKVVVKGPAKGRRRIGRKFTAEQVTILLADLTPDELEALQNDQELVVVLI